jgi:hypothetical protein
MLRGRPAPAHPRNTEADRAEHDQREKDYPQVNAPAPLRDVLICRPSSQAEHMIRVHGW